MSTDYWDALEVSLAESVVADRVIARVAVVRACQNHPRAPASYLILALSSMAVTLEEEWLRGTLADQRQLLDVYRAMIALSADLAALDLRNLDRETCNDLLIYWQGTEDPFFVVAGA